MSAIAVAPVRTVVGFPREEVERAMRKWWQDRLNDPFGPAKGKKNTLYEILPAIDSLSVTDVLLVVEEIVGFEIPVEVVKRGGYENDDEMISHLLLRIEKLHGKRNK